MNSYNYLVFVLADGGWFGAVVTSLIMSTNKYVDPRLVLGLVTFSEYTIPVFTQATQARHSAWLSLRG